MASAPESVATPSSEATTPPTQYFPDGTAKANKPYFDSVLFSVRIGTECLLGQLSGSQYTSSVQAALTSGTCLVGKTRPIDW
jgi:hypothetical protein